MAAMCDSGPRHHTDNHGVDSEQIPVTSKQTYFLHLREKSALGGSYIQVIHAGLFAVFSGFHSAANSTK
jgi:hypothetical protein